MASLLQRLYDTSSGQILVDGTNIKDWNVQTYRAHIGVVGQEPVLFDLTVSENIKYGFVRQDGSSPSQADVEEAARLANIHDFIMTLPDKYETVRIVYKVIV